MDGYVGSVDGKVAVRHQMSGDVSDPIALGDAMVAALLDMGAGEILAEIRSAADVDDLLAT